MKKISFVLLFLLLNTFLYSQSDVMQHLSLGYNTKSTQGGVNTYFFYGFEDYSEAYFYDYSSYVHLALSTRTPWIFYPGGRLRDSPTEYYRFSVQSNSNGYRFNEGGSFYSEEQRFENGRLVYWASFFRRIDGVYIPSMTSQRIEQNSQSIKIYATNSEGWRQSIYSYYNISRTELLELFLRRYVRLICEINDAINNTNNYDEYLFELVRARTPRELAIFRNCLYALKGYRFINSEWADFFTKYLNDYRPQYSENEVTAMFTDSEKWLLYLIIRYENGN
jgi:hypothetical protein